MFIFLTFRFNNNNWQLPLSPQHGIQQKTQHLLPFQIAQQQNPHHVHRTSVPVNHSNMSPCDAELHNIFMNGAPQTPPNNRLINPNNRCQSVPVSQNATTGLFQPLTPQLHRHNSQEQQNTLNAKRNLNFMFDDVPTLIPFNSNGSNNNVNINHCPGVLNSEVNDRIVPTNTNLDQRDILALQHHVPHPLHQGMFNHQQHHQHQQQQQHHEQNIYDLGFQLNDLSTPEEMNDIAGNLDNIDSDDLIKSLDKPVENNWVDDWSNATIPLMNVN